MTCPDCQPLTWRDIAAVIVVSLIVGVPAGLGLLYLADRLLP